MKYVLGVKEADEVEETIDHSTFGTFVHDSLELLYKPFVKKNITAEDLKEMLKQANSPFAHSAITIIKRHKVEQLACRWLNSYDFDTQQQKSMLCL